MRGPVLATLGGAIGLAAACVAGPEIAEPPRTNEPVADGGPPSAPALPDGGAERLPLDDLALRGDARCADGRLYEASWFVSDLRYSFTRVVVYRDGRIVVAGDGAAEGQLDPPAMVELYAKASGAQLARRTGRYEDDPFTSPSYGGAVAACVAGKHHAAEWQAGGSPGVPPAPREVLALHGALRAAADALRGPADGGSPGPAPAP